MSEIIPRVTVVDMVAHRDLALANYETAHAALVEAYERVQQARVIASRASAGVNRYNHHSDQARKYFLTEDDVPTKEDFMAEARRLTDTDVWARIITMTDMERLMDKKAKDEFNQQLLQDPPEATVENVYATIRQLFADSDMIFRRGVAECFSNLDRRFRSHDGWKIGSRVILSYAFDEWGSWNYHRNHRDTLIDIERAFFVIEGEEQPANYGGIVGAVEQARKGGWGRRQSEVETEFFLVRCYKNGNCHIWFKRDDLLEKVNGLLGEYYGDVIPEEREPDGEDVLNVPKTSLARNKGWFPTPDKVADVLLEGVLPYDDPEECDVLEPSAGEGALAEPLAAKGARVDCVEIDHERVAKLESSMIYSNVTHADFLRLEPGRKQYDRVVMNPPFDRERDVDHIMHALKFLKDDGMLVAVMAAGIEFRSTKKSEAFRKLMEEMNANWRDVPPRSFSEVGTNVNTVILRVRKDGRQMYW